MAARALPGLAAGRGLTPGRRFDAVVSGQTWHWVNPVAGAAEAAETLRPDGRLAGARLGQPGPLAVCWNVQEPPPDVAEAVSEVYRRVLSARRSTPPAWARTR